MRGLTRFLMTVEKQLEGIAASPTTDTPNNSSTTETPLTIPDMVRCPITGMQMTSPVIASDSISYEKKDIEAWIQRMGRVSPVSRSILDETLPPNRALKDIIDELPRETSQPTPEVIMRVRLQASLNWIVRSKFQFLNPDILQSAYNDFSMCRLPEDPWPLLHCPEACVEFVWAHCVHLCAMVYAEFANAAGEVPHVSGYTKHLASRHFVDSMRKRPFDSKTNQLSKALNSAYSVPATADNGDTYYRPFDVTCISTNWTVVWGDPRPQMPRRQPSMYDPNVAMYPPEYFTNRRAGPDQNAQDSSRRVHFSMADPQVDDRDWTEYGRFATGGLHRFAQDPRYR
jgi:hypothetical protein